MTSFDEHQAGLFEVIFQKTARLDGSTIQKLAMEMQISSRIVWGWFQKQRTEATNYLPEREKHKCAITNSYEDLFLEVFNHIFYQKVISFTIEAHEEYDTQLKTSMKSTLIMKF